MTDEPKPVKAWAVILEEPDIRPDFVFGMNRNKTSLKNDFPGCRVIPVLITPIGEDHD